MRHYSLNAIEKLKNLHSFLYTDEMEFHPEKMIIDLGLYDTLLIDTSDIKIKYSNLEAHSKSDPVKIVSKVEVWIWENEWIIHVNVMDFEDVISKF